MLRLAVLIHLLAYFGFYNFLVKYVTTTFSGTKLCDEIYRCSIRNNNNQSAFSHCPSLNCTGEERCCSYCESTFHLTSFSDSDHVALDYTLHFPLFIDELTQLLLILLVVFILLFFINLHKHRISHYVTGFFLITFQVIALFAVVVIAGQISIDHEYYLHCQSNSALMISMGLMFFFIFTDISIRILPTIKNGIIRIKLKREALSEACDMETLSRNMDQRLRNFEKRKRKHPIDKIFPLLLRICFLWWIIIFIYFMGLRTGRWYAKYAKEK